MPFPSGRKPSPPVFPHFSYLCRMRIVNRILPFLLFAACCMPVRAQQRETYSVAGRVIDRLTRQPVPYASVVVAGDERKGASSDSTGRFVIELSLIHI